MRDKVKIQGLGEVCLRPPKSFVTINDLISEYGANQDNHAKLARLSAAILAICWDHEKNKLHPPLYDVSSAEVIRYGGEVLEWLINRKVVLKEVYSQTLPLFVELWEMMPKEDEVAKATETFQEEGKSGRSSDADREAMAAGA